MPYHDVVVIQLVTKTDREIGLRVALNGYGHLSDTRRITVQSRTLKVFVVALLCLGCCSQLDVNLERKTIENYELKKLNK